VKDECVNKYVTALKSIGLDNIRWNIVIRYYGTWIWSRKRNVCKRNSRRRRIAVIKVISRAGRAHDD
jgi:hypothetical protein